MEVKFLTLDSFYKNSVYFPVTGIGYMDNNRHYKLLALVIINKETTDIYNKIFSMLNKIYTNIFLEMFL